MNQHIRIIRKFPHLLQASTVMEKHNATRNTAFTNAPNTSARAQPNVFFDHFFGDICKDKPLLYIYKAHNRKQELWTDYAEVMMKLWLPVV
jgi:hypothetical protein